MLHEIFPSANEISQSIRQSTNKLLSMVIYYFMKFLLFVYGQLSRLSDVYIGSTCLTVHFISFATTNKFLTAFLELREHEKFLIRTRFYLLSEPFKENDESIS